MKRIIFTLLAAALMSVSVMAVEPTREKTIAIDEDTQAGLYIDEDLHTFTVVVTAALVEQPVAALDDLTQSTAARKVVVNGQVLIIKDGKTFNLLGAEVK